MHVLSTVFATILANRVYAHFASDNTQHAHFSRNILQMFFEVYGVYGMLRCGFPHIKMTHLWRIYGAHGAESQREREREKGRKSERERKRYTMQIHGEDMTFSSAKSG